MTAKLPTLRLFQQASSPFYYASFYYHRTKYQTSLKTADLKEAQAKAQDWFLASLVALRSGQQPTKTSNHSQKINRIFPSKTFSFIEQAKRAIADYEHSARSKETINHFKSHCRIICEQIGATDIREFSQKTWTEFKAALSKNASLSPRTFDKYKSGIQSIFKEARRRGDLSTTFRFEREFNPTVETTRTYFNRNEYRQLLKELRLYREHEQTIIATELADYAQLMRCFGTRVRELSNARFCDISINARTIESQNRGTIQVEYLALTNIMGKRTRFGSTKFAFSTYQAAAAFRRILARHNLSDDPKAKNYFKNCTDCLWTTSEQQRSRAFKQVTEQCNLYKTADRVPKVRVLASLRNTYIVAKIEAKKPLSFIAKNCRTSEAMITKNYAAFFQPTEEQIN
jgi:hypothetical protein